jgi:solute carrier family 25 oxoglutarate transporter 11
MATTNMGDNVYWKTVKPFMNGGMSGMAATICIQPIDMVKVRLQTGETGGPIGVAMRMIKADGPGALYKGLSAGLLRQATYTTARLGIYNTLSEKLTADGRKSNALEKAGCGLMAGGLGAIFGSPADLSLIRMQVDSQLPKAEQRGYKNAADAMVKIVAADGFGGLFAGAAPTAVRAMALNMGMLASNDVAKEFIMSQGFEKGTPAVIFGASSIAGFFASACSLPFDYVKTQMQKMKPLPDGTMPFSSSMDCAAKTLKEGGPLKFYTGFPTYFVRIAPHAMITLVVLDTINKAQKEAGW